MLGVHFDSTKQSLQEILREIEQGKMQLPDFQRGWVWDDDRVKSLLAGRAPCFGPFKARLFGLR